MPILDGTSLAHQPDMDGHLLPAQSRVRRASHLPWRWHGPTRQRPTIKSAALALWKEALADGGAIDSGAQLAYWALLAMFPFFVLALTLVAFLPLHGLDQQLIDFIWQVMPHDVAQLCDSVLREVVGKQHGMLLVVALIGAVWTSSGAVSATMQALNHVWGVKETRPYWKAKGTSLGITAGGAILVVVGMIALLVGTAVGTTVMTQLFGTHGTPIGGAILRYGVVCAAMLILTGICYRLLPNLHGKRAVWPGAIFATTAWIGVSLAFAFYLGHFASYSKVYGALGTIVVLMTWLYLGSIMLVLGGALNAAWDHAADPAQRGAA